MSVPMGVHLSGIQLVTALMNIPANILNPPASWLGILGAVLRVWGLLGFVVLVRGQCGVAW